VNRKLVVFVPREALDIVRDALFEAGAGRIGDYRRCSWYTEGTGTFLGGESTSPDVYPVELEADVVAALRKAHPYEEPAFDLYPLADHPA
jgi:hypothetical protein